MLFLRTLLISVSLMAGLYLALVIVIDPRADFETGRFPAVVQDVRAVKMRLFRAALQHEPITGLVLGSSRSMKLNPADLQRRTGQPFFNFAVDNARTEDYLAIYRWVKAQGTHPRLMIIGVDIEDLHDNNTPNDQLVCNDALYRYAQGRQPAWAPIAHALAWGKRVKAAFSTRYAGDIVKSVTLTLHHADTTPFMAFTGDGYLRYHRWERERQQGTFNAELTIAGSVEEYQRRMTGMHRLSPTRQRDLEQLIREAENDHAEVVLWLTPLHPRVRQQLDATTRYPALLSEAQQYLAELGRQPGVRAVDLHDITRYGSITDWYDGAHVNEINAHRIIIRLTEGGQ